MNQAVVNAPNPRGAPATQSHIDTSQAGTAQDTLQAANIMNVLNNSYSYAYNQSGGRRIQGPKITTGTRASIEPPIFVKIAKFSVIWMSSRKRGLPRISVLPFGILYQPSVLWTDIEANVRMTVDKAIANSPTARRLLSGCVHRFEYGSCIPFLCLGTKLITVLNCQRQHSMDTPH